MQAYPWHSMARINAQTAALLAGIVDGHTVADAAEVAPSGCSPAPTSPSAWSSCAARPSARVQAARAVFSQALAFKQAGERSALVAAAQHRVGVLARGGADVTPEVANRIRRMLTAAVHPPGEPVKPRAASGSTAMPASRSAEEATMFTRKRAADTAAALALAERVHGTRRPGRSRQAMSRWTRCSSTARH